MSGPDKDAVFHALGSLQIPGTDTDVVSAGLISHVAACDGLIAVLLKNFGGVAGAETKDAVQASIRDTVTALDGVKQVKIKFDGDETVARGDSSVVKPGVGDVKHIITIGSGKGGVGKSTLTTNLAVSLAKSGAKVGLLDTDVYGPSIPLMLGKKEHPPLAGQVMLPLEAHGVNPCSSS